MDGAANAAGVTPREASYHTDGSLSSVEGPRPRGGAARVAARGPCAPCGFPGGPHGGPRPRQPTPHPAPLASPRSPRPPPPRSLLCVGGGYGRQSTPPCMPSASDGRCGRGLPSRRRQYDGRIPRPAAAVPRRSGFVTPRPLPAQGRAGGWDEAHPEPTGTASAPLAAAVGGWWANKVRFRGVCPHGAHSGKSAAGLASLGAYAQQCAPGGAVDGASWVIPSAAPPF